MMPYLSHVTIIILKCHLTVFAMSGPIKFSLICNSMILRFVAVLLVEIVNDVYQSI